MSEGFHFAVPLQTQRTVSVLQTLTLRRGLGNQAGARQFQHHRSHRVILVRKDNLEMVVSNPSLAILTLAQPGPPAYGIRSVTTYVPSKKAVINRDCLFVRFTRGAGSSKHALARTALPRSRAYRFRDTGIPAPGGPAVRLLEVSGLRVQLVFQRCCAPCGKKTSPGDPRCK